MIEDLRLYATFVSADFLAWLDDPIVERLVCWSNESLVNTCQPHLAGNPSQQSIVAKRYGEQDDAAVACLAAIDVLPTREIILAAHIERPGSKSCRTLQHHDWQVASLLVETDRHAELLPMLASNKRPRLGTRRSAWPT